jgi:polyisoprenoid-binding protein YceI
VVEGELGKARALGIAFEQALAFEKAAHAAGDAARQSAELGAGGRLDPAGDLQTTVNRSDFGLKKYLSMVSDEVRITISVEAIREDR